MGLIRLIFEIYIWILIADVILSYFPQFRNKDWRIYIRKATDFTCKPIRDLLPRDLPFDFSPLIVILILNLFTLLF